MKYLSLLLFLFFSVFFSGIHAQDRPNITGTWDGFGLIPGAGGADTVNIVRMTITSSPTLKDSLYVELSLISPGRSKGIHSSLMLLPANGYYVTANGQIKFHFIKGDRALEDRLFVNAPMGDRSAIYTFVKTAPSVLQVLKPGQTANCAYEKMKSLQDKYGTTAYNTEQTKAYISCLESFIDLSKAEFNYILPLSVLRITLPYFLPINIIVDKITADKIMYNKYALKINIFQGAYTLQYMAPVEMKISHPALSAPIQYPQKQLMELWDMPFYKNFINRDKPIEMSGKTVSINPNDITVPANKKFKWYTLAKLPPAILQAIKMMRVGQQTIYEKISEWKGECDVEVALTDLNENGIYGVAIYTSGRTCCGSRGCSYEFYEDGGMLVNDLGTDYDVMPGKGGVIASNGKFFPFYPKGNYDNATRTKIQQLFSYKQGSVVQPSTNVKNYPGGGTTPNELGEILLNALKTNNAALWNSSVHPIDKKYLDFNKAAFTKFRKKLIESGVADWSQVKFSRTTYNYENISGHDDNGEVNGEKVYRNFVVEFTYKDKFIGGIGKMTISSVLRKKFYIFFAGLDAGMIRK